MQEKYQRLLYCKLINSEQSKLLGIKVKNNTLMYSGIDQKKNICLNGQIERSKNGTH